MNMITVDVTDIAEAAPDDEVVLAGQPGRGPHHREEVADWCGTISYEIYCRIGRHPFKQFLNGSG